MLDIIYWYIRFLSFYGPTKQTLPSVEITHLNGQNVKYSLNAWKSIISSCHNKLACECFFFYTHEETLKPVFHPRASCAAACAMCACLCIQAYLISVCWVVELTKKKRNGQVHFWSQRFMSLFTKKRYITPINAKRINS